MCASWEYFLEYSDAQSWHYQLFPFGITGGSLSSPHSVQGLLDMWLEIVLWETPTPCVWLCYEVIPASSESLQCFVLLIQHLSPCSVLELFMNMSYLLTHTPWRGWDSVTPRGHPLGPLGCMPSVDMFSLALRVFKTFKITCQLLKSRRFSSNPSISP